MSYDYNQLLNEIRTSRSITPRASSDIENSIQLFSTLSANCPMTPMLWMQYAHDAGLVMDACGEGGGFEITSQILELGVAEFPGCALLRLYHLDCVLAVAKGQTADDDDNNDHVKSVWEEVVKAVCLGSHAGCDEKIVVAIFNMYANYLVKYDPKEIGPLFVQRSQLFMKHANDTLRSEMGAMSEKDGVIFTDNDISIIEKKRQFVSQHMRFLESLEDDVLISMELDSIASPTEMELLVIEAEDNNNNDGQGQGLTHDWGNILKYIESKSPMFLMGLGMVQTSESFTKYVQTIIQEIKGIQKQIKQTELQLKQHQHQHDEEENEFHQQMKDKLNTLRSMIIPVFERTVAESPTAETMWEKYTKHLLFMLHNNNASTSTSDQQQQSSNFIQETLAQLKNVTSRAVRNCPYSIKLFSIKMTAILEEVNAGTKILDPDELMDIVNEAIEGNFLPTPESHVEIYMNACNIVKQRILDLVSRATSNISFDETESCNNKDSSLHNNNGKKRKRTDTSSAFSCKLYNNVIDEEIEQEYHDLIDDLREMYDAADSFVKKNFAHWSEGRQIIFRDKAITEAYICIPLLGSSSSNKTNTNNDDALGHFDKLLKIHQPVHPESYKCYIRYLMGTCFNGQQDNGNDNDDNHDVSDTLAYQSPGTTVAKLRYIRNLYRQAMTVTNKRKKGKQDIILNSNFVTSMQTLCQDYQDFENNFGSSQSKANATKLIESKLSSLQQLQSHESVTDNVVEEEKSTKLEEEGRPTGTNDRKRTRMDDPNPSDNVDIPEDHATNAKRIKLQPCVDDSNNKNETPIPSNNQSKKSEPSVEVSSNVGGTEQNTNASHKVLIGTLEYPAHPFTIHVSNLSNATSDMDLYDLFRTKKCGGAVVHARIFREKQQHPVKHVFGQYPKSKCAGLVQFEERESVEKALKLNGEIGLHDKLITITRSNQPAVSVVPPGMHRVQPKGQGKSTKRNDKRKERRMKSKSESKEKGDIAVLPSDGGQSNRNEDSTSQQASKVGILSMRPRGVTRKKRKEKMNL